MARPVSRRKIQHTAIAKGMVLEIHTEWYGVTTVKTGLVHARKITGRWTHYTTMAGGILLELKDSSFVGPEPKIYSLIAENEPVLFD